MPRPPANLEPFRSEIEDRVFIQKQSQLGIVEWLSEQGVTCSKQTLLRRCREWGVTRRNQNRTNLALIEAIKNEYFTTPKVDADIAASLNAQGIITTKQQVQDIRLKHAWRRRAYSHDQLVDQRRETFRKVEQLLAQNPPRTSRTFVIPALREQYHYQAREKDVRDALKFFLRRSGAQTREEAIQPSRRNGIPLLEDEGILEAAESYSPGPPEDSTSEDDHQDRSLGGVQPVQQPPADGPAPWPPGIPRPVSKPSRGRASKKSLETSYPIFDMPVHPLTTEARQQWLASARETLSMVESQNASLVPADTVKAALNAAIELIGMQHGQRDGLGRGYIGSHAYQ